MAVSLNNKRNTQIVDNGKTVELIHHGSRTCIIDGNMRQITIDLCGWDTVTTRGKINAFCDKFNIPLSLYRKKGKTWVRFDNEHFELESAHKPLQVYLN